MRIFNGIYLPLGVLLVSIIFYACNLDGSIASGDFDPKRWKAMYGSLATQNPRGKMLGDLRENYLKPGMIQSEVEALLGHADRVKNHHYLYRLGTGKFSVDYNYLTLIYDSDGRLKEIRYAQS
jgi:hypothetical protein